MEAVPLFKRWFAIDFADGLSHVCFVIYRRRRNAVSRSEREWRVERDALVSVGSSGRARRWAWRDIVSVRLYYDPTPQKPFRHAFELQPRDGAKIELDNAHFLSRGNFEERSDTYAPFVHAALERVAAENPKARALIGETPRRYFFLMLGSLLALGALAFALVTVRSPLDALPFADLAKFGVILLMLPVFGIWVMRAMPRGVALDSIPERALPPQPQSHET